MISRRLPRSLTGRDRRVGSGGRESGALFAKFHAVIRRIPRGRVATYGQVAALAGLPRHARHVGYALHGAPEGILPWHRVVGAGGSIRLREPGGAWTQRLRLEREGVRFSPRGRVRMKEFAWRPERAGRGGRRGA